MIDIKKQIENPNPQRYVLSVVAGQEELVIKNLMERVKKENLDNDVVDYLNPLVNETSRKKGEKVVKQKKLYPGYVFFKSKMNDKIRFVVRNTPGVRLIVGADTQPIPVSDDEHQKILDQIKKSEERSDFDIPFQPGDVVILKGGDFAGMKGAIRNIDGEKAIAVVNLEMLGRLTPVAIALDKIELAS